MNLKPIGEAAWLASFEDEDTATRWARAVEEADIAGVTDVVPAYRTVGVHADLASIRPESVEERLKSLPVPIGSDERDSRLHDVPVLYDGEDLSDAADRLGLRWEELVELHAATTYRVHAVGFQPGFPYLGYLKPPLDRLARLARPRLKVPAGSVAVAAGQTGIYPTELPGGWNLLGRTPLVIVDLRDAYFPIRVGDRVKFRPIDAAEFEARKGDRL